MNIEKTVREYVDFKIELCKRKGIRPKALLMNGDDWNILKAYRAVDELFENGNRYKGLNVIIIDKNINPMVLV